MASNKDSNIVTYLNIHQNISNRVYHIDLTIDNLNCA